MGFQAMSVFMAEWRPVKTEDWQAAGFVQMTSLCDQHLAGRSDGTKRCFGVWSMIMQFFFPGPNVAAFCFTD